MLDPRACLSPREAEPWVVESLFDALPNVTLFIKDADAKYVTVNDRLAARCGVAKADLIGRRADEVFNGSIGESFSEMDRIVIEEAREFRDILELYWTHDRSPIWCLTYKFPLQSHTGRVVGLIGVASDLPEPDERHDDFTNMMTVLERIEADVSQELRVAHLASSAGLSQDRLRQLSKEVFGLNPKQLITKARLEHAMRALDGTMSIADVAHSSGYADHSAFTRQFRTVTGMTPRQYRTEPKRADQGDSLDLPNRPSRSESNGRAVSPNAE